MNSPLDAPPPLPVGAELLLLSLGSTGWLGSGVGMLTAGDAGLELAAAGALAGDAAAGRCSLAGAAGFSGSTGALGAGSAGALGAVGELGAGVAGVGLLSACADPPSPVGVRWLSAIDAASAAFTGVTADSGMGI